MSDEISRPTTKSERQLFQVPNKFGNRKYEWKLLLNRLAQRCSLELWINPSVRVFLVHHIYIGELSGGLRSPPSFSFRGISAMRSCLRRFTEDPLPLGPRAFPGSVFVGTVRAPFHGWPRSIIQVVDCSDGPCWPHAYVITKVFYGISLHFPHVSWTNHPTCHQQAPTLFIVKSRQPIPDSKTAHMYFPGPWQIKDISEIKSNYSTVIFERHMCENSIFMKTFKIWA